MPPPLGSLRLLVLFASFLGSATARAACADYAADPDRLVELEAGASRGALEPELLECLEASYAASRQQETKEKISRVLLVNAYATDTAEWAKLVQRHLDEVDRSDPDIAYLYAFYLYNHDTPSGDVIHWSDVGLERRQAWTGNVHVARVNGLLRLRTLASLSEWQGLAARAVSDASLRTQAEEARVRTKTYAREWLDFAREARRDTTQPMDICLSAANAEACGIQ